MGKEEIRKRRLENFMTAEDEVGRGRSCTIMGRTFTGNDLGYIKQRIGELKKGGIS